MTAEPSPHQPPNPNPGDPPPVDPAARAALSRPDNLPDHYWDAATGLRANELVTDFNKLNADATKRAETFKDFPKDAAKAGDFYKLPEQLLPEGVTAPKGMEIKPNTDLLSAALPILHKHQVAPAAFQDLAQAVTAYELGKHEKAMAEFAADAKKLGDKADARRQAVGAGLEALVGPEDAKFFDPSAMTSGAIEWFERLLQRVTDQGGVAPFRRRQDNDPPPPPKTIEQRWYGGQQQKAS